MGYNKENNFNSLIILYYSFLLIKRFLFQNFRADIPYLKAYLLQVVSSTFKSPSPHSLEYLLSYLLMCKQTLPYLLVRILCFNSTFETLIFINSFFTFPKWLMFLESFFLINQLILSKIKSHKCSKSELLLLQCYMGCVINIRCFCVQI